MTQLTPSFTLEELTRTNVAADNTPNAQQKQLLTTLAQFLEKVRVILGNKPISINSAFRSHAVNVAVGGVDNSAHTLCFAADIECPAFGTPYQVALALDAAEKAGKIKFDQLIHERIISEGSNWVHISRDPRLRGQRRTTFDRVNYPVGILP
jgi:zinc D-Ala-D-Ala carboxypeptidase